MTSFGLIVFADVISVRISRWIRVGSLSNDKCSVTQRFTERECI